jgi:ERCC4-type nuclease
MIDRELERARLKEVLEKTQKKGKVLTTCPTDLIQKPNNDVVPKLAVCMEAFDSELPLIIIDQREQEPYSFRRSKNCLGGVCGFRLMYGDYQLFGYPDLIAIERKHNVTELCGNLGKNRKRFERELERMQNAQFRYVIVEDYWSSIWRAKYTRMHPNAIFQSIIALELKYGVHFTFTGNRKIAHQLTRSLLLKAHKYCAEGKI